MKLRFVAILAAFLWQFSDNLLFAAWPLKNAALVEVGTITDIYSSRRSKKRSGKITYYFHNGVDISANEGTKVYALASGMATNMLFDDPAENFLTVTGGDGSKYSYGHIVSEVADGTIVTIGDPIGTIASHKILNHLHFTIWDQFGNPIKNPLAPDGPITDKDADPVWKPVVKDIYFRSDDSGRFGGAIYGVDGSLTAYGAVDMVSPAMDSSGGVTNKQSDRQDAGVMQLMWKIGENGAIKYLLKDGQWDGSLYQPMAGQLFNEADIPCDTGISTATTDADKQEYYYILTNTADPNDGRSIALSKLGAWNTKLKKGAAWFDPNISPINGDLAEINDVDSPSGPEYPDGPYAIYARAGSDEAADLGEWFERPVTIDNFRPYVKQVEVKQGITTLYKRSWELDEKSMLRSYAPSVEEPIIPGEYTVITTFSEPMGSASLVGGNYAFTPYTTVLVSSITIGADTQDSMRPLEIYGADIAGTANELLAIEPGRSYIDPARELTRDAAGGMQGTGGTDRFHSLRIEAAPPVIEYEDRNNTLAHSCGGTTCGTQAEPINLAWSRVRFRYKDIGSGIKDIVISNIETGTVVRPFSYQPQVYIHEILLDLPDGLYKQVVTDNSGKETTMWFRLDPDSPLLRISAIDMSSDFNTFTASGTVQDTDSGMDFLRLDRSDVLVTSFTVIRGSKELINFTTPVLDVGGDGYYVFSAYDKAGNGSFQQPIFQFIKTAGIEAPGQTYPVANYISEVKTGSGPCTITITSARNTFPVPVRYGLEVDSITISVPAGTQVVAAPNLYLYGNININVAPRICDEQNICHDACAVSLGGHSVLSLRNGPAEAFVRNTSQPANGVIFRFEWSEITFFDLVAIPENKLTLESVPAPAAPANYVVDPPGLNRSLRVKYPGAFYSGIKIKTCGLPPGSAARLKMYHYTDSGVGNDITTQPEGDCITGFSTTASRFSVVAPLSMYDNAGPVVDFRIQDGFETGGLTYISSSSPVALAAEDRSSNTFALAGVASTYYLLDAEPTPACLGTAYDPAAAPGSCPNPLYDGPFRLNEGIRSIYYSAVDKIGNIGEGRFAQLRVDSTPPESALLLNGLPIAPGATVYAATTDLITLAATDAISNGVTSGLATTYFLVDVSPEDCEYAEWAGGGINGMGNCENSFYARPFSLPAGGHTIYYQSVDNVGNKEAGKRVFVSVSAKRAAPQESAQRAAEFYKRISESLKNTRNINEGVPTNGNTRHGRGIKR